MTRLRSDLELAQFFGMSCGLEINRACSNDRRVAHEYAAMRARQHAIRAHRYAMLARPDLRDETQGEE